MGAASLINLIRRDVLKTLKNEFSGFELATVMYPPPELVIKIDNMKAELTGGDLILCERLLKNKKTVSLKSTQENPAWELSMAELQFEEELKTGDRILVQAVQGGQKYIVIDKVVE